MNEQTPVKRRKKIKLTRSGKLLAAGAAAAAIIISAAVSGLKSDKNPRSTSAAALEVGTEKISAAEFCYFYYQAYQQAVEQSNFSTSAVSSGSGEDTQVQVFDPSVSPAEQNYPFEDESGKIITWEEALKKQATENAHDTAVFYAEAQNEGILLNHYENQTIDATIDWHAENAEKAGLSLEDYFNKNFGMGEDELRGIMEKEAIASKYRSILKIELSDSVSAEELKNTFIENSAAYSKSTVRCAFFPFASLVQGEGETDDAFAKRGEAEKARLLEVVQSIAKEISNRKTFDSVTANYITKDTDTGAVCTLCSGCMTHDDLAENTDKAVANWVCEPDRREDMLNVISGEKGIYIVLIVKPNSGEHHSVTVRCCFKAVGEKGLLSTMNEANDLLKGWKSAKEKSLFTFASMCRAHTDNDQINGDEMIIRAGDTYPAIDDWCFNSKRKEGDTAVLQAGETGYYIVYFVSDNTDDLDWQDAARTAVGQQKFDEACLELYSEKGDYKLKEYSGKITKAVEYFNEAVLKGDIIFEK